jgi:hypothetical protein
VERRAGATVRQSRPASTPVCAASHPIVVLDRGRRPRRRPVDRLARARRPHRARRSADLALSDRTTLAEPGALTHGAARSATALATRLIAAGHRAPLRRPGAVPRAAVGVARSAWRMEDPTWGWNVEMQLKAVRAGLRVLEVPSSRTGGRERGASKVSGSLQGAARAGVRILWAVQHYARAAVAARRAGYASRPLRPRVPHARPRRPRSEDHPHTSTSWASAAPPWARSPACCRTPATRSPAPTRAIYPPMSDYLAAWASP